MTDNYSRGFWSGYFAGIITGIIIAAITFYAINRPPAFTIPTPEQQMEDTLQVEQGRIPDSPFLTSIDSVVAGRGQAFEMEADSWRLTAPEMHSYSFIRTPEWSLDSIMIAGGYSVQFKGRMGAKKGKGRLPWIILWPAAVDSVHKSMKSMGAAIRRQEFSAELEKEVDSL